MVDYRRFLGATAQQVLPYFFGGEVQAADRRLALKAPPPRPGWYRFELKGRGAVCLGEAPAPDLSALPAVRGVFLGGALVREGAQREGLWAFGAEEPAAFSPVTARRWPSGELLLDRQDFESGVEGELREALAGGLGLGDLKGVSAPLRAAFGFAVLQRAAVEASTQVAWAEVRAALVDVAQGGPGAARAAVARLQAERAQATAELAALNQQRAAARTQEDLRAARAARLAAGGDPVPLAAAALAKAGAALESARRLNEGQLEVVFAYAHERFICVVEADTLRLLDSGICLGHPPRDDELTLDSLPGVIQEAMDEDALVILRFP